MGHKAVSQIFCGLFVTIWHVLHGSKIFETPEREIAKLFRYNRGIEVTFLIP